MYLLIYLPGSAQGQVGGSFEQPGLVEGVPAHGRAGWNLVIFKVPSNPEHSVMILWKQSKQVLLSESPGALATEWWALDLLAVCLHSQK